MSSRKQSESAKNVSMYSENPPSTDGTVTCFWSSADPEWYDDYVSGRDET